MANADLVVPTFRVHTTQNEAKSRKEGRPIFDEMEVLELRFGGDRQKVSVFPAHEAEPNATRDSLSAGGGVVTYAQVYNKQYRAFKDQTTQEVEGTPLSEAPFLTEAKRRELRALNIHTVEALAALDGNPLRQLGMGGRELKDQAQAYLDNAKGSADVTSLAAEIAALKVQLQIRDEETAALRRSASPITKDGDPAKPGLLTTDSREDEDGEDEQSGTSLDKDLDDCTDAELKTYIKAKTGAPVLGNPNRETLMSRAMDLATKPDAE